MTLSTPDKTDIPAFYSARFHPAQNSAMRRCDPGHVEKAALQARFPPDNADNIRAQGDDYCYVAANTPTPRARGAAPPGDTSRMTTSPHPIDILAFLTDEGVACPTIKIVDVGAMDVGEAEPWSRLVTADAATLIGFEPNAPECEKLKQAGRANCQFLPHALGDGGRHVLHIGTEPMTSSLYPPDPAVMQQFHALWELCEPVRKEPLETVRLDDVTEAQPADFLKLDVQGAELLVLEGAVDTLTDTLAVQTEVNFLPIYKGQALFADVDIFLRAQGFTFHTMVGVGSRPYRPLIKDGNPNRGFAQVIWSNAVYLRDPADFPELAQSQPEALLKLAVLTHELYGAFDFAALALQHYGAAHKPGLATAYIRALMVADPSITAQK